MPEETPKADVIMVATGTGIAPFRGFLRRLFVEPTEASANFKGLAWLLLGVANKASMPYRNEIEEIQRNNPTAFRFDSALSREQLNSAGSKMYVQHKLEEHGEEIFERMNNGAHIYFCGLKSMMPGILETFRVICERKGMNNEQTLRLWKERKQWHAEVY